MTSLRSPSSTEVLSSSLSSSTSACNKKDTLALEAVQPLVGDKGDKDREQEQDKEEGGGNELEL